NSLLEWKTTDWTAPVFANSILINIKRYVIPAVDWALTENNALLSGNVHTISDQSVWISLAVAVSYSTALTVVNFRGDDMSMLSQARGQFEWRRFDVIFDEATSRQPGPISILVSGKRFAPLSYTCNGPSDGMSLRWSCDPIQPSGDITPRDVLVAIAACARERQESQFVIYAFIRASCIYNRYRGPTAAGAAQAYNSLLEWKTTDWTAPVFANSILINIKRYVIPAVDWALTENNALLSGNVHTISDQSVWISLAVAVSYSTALTVVNFRGDDMSMLSQARGQFEWRRFDVIFDEATSRQPGPISILVSGKRFAPLSYTCNGPSDGMSLRWSCDPIQPSGDITPRDVLVAIAACARERQESQFVIYAFIRASCIYNRYRGPTAAGAAQAYNSLLEWKTTDWTAPVFANSILINIKRYVIPAVDWALTENNALLSGNVHTISDQSVWISLAVAVSYSTALTVVNFRGDDMSMLSQARGQFEWRRFDVIFDEATSRQPGPISILVSGKRFAPLSYTCNGPSDGMSLRWSCDPIQPSGDITPRDVLVAIAACARERQESQFVIYAFIRASCIYNRYRGPTAAGAAQAYNSLLEWKTTDWTAPVFANSILINIKRYVIPAVDWALTENNALLSGNVHTISDQSVWISLAVAVSYSTALTVVNFRGDDMSMLSQARGQFEWRRFDVIFDEATSRQPGPISILVSGKRFAPLSYTCNGPSDGMSLRWSCDPIQPSGDITPRDVLVAIAACARERQESQFVIYAFIRASCIYNRYRGPTAAGAAQAYNSLLEWKTTDWTAPVFANSILINIKRYVIPAVDWALTENNALLSGNVHTISDQSVWISLAVAVSYSTALTVVNFRGDDMSMLSQARGQFEWRRFDVIFDEATSRQPGPISILVSGKRFAPLSYTCNGPSDGMSLRWSCDPIQPSGDITPRDVLVAIAACARERQESQFVIYAFIRASCIYNRYRGPTAAGAAQAYNSLLEWKTTDWTAPVFANSILINIKRYVIPAVDWALTENNALLSGNVHTISDQSVWISLAVAVSYSTALTVVNFRGDDMSMLSQARGQFEWRRFDVIFDEATSRQPGPISILVSGKRFAPLSYTCNGPSDGMSLRWSCDPIQPSGDITPRDVLVAIAACARERQESQFVIYAFIRASCIYNRYRGPTAAGAAQAYNSLLEWKTTDWTAPVFANSILINIKRYVIPAVDWALTENNALLSGNVHTISDQSVWISLAVAVSYSTALTVVNFRGDDMSMLSQARGQFEWRRFDVIFDEATSRQPGRSRPMIASIASILRRK
ncbi:hypothetical protein GJ496_008048, partial [Pomphorhynchus laevis]